ncbi:MAG: hypothetical protein R3F40_09185 [Candidatus Competibacteraceae bacterium]
MGLAHYTDLPPVGHHLAVVVAYPYVPGSQSDAFKAHLDLSRLDYLLAHRRSSLTVAGYSLAYRRPFKIGDRVKINGIPGDVMEMRVLVARLHYRKTRRSSFLHHDPER